ncbi:egf domain-specific o-linked n-acetylglucosamine transferase [Phtheirospermum japonicum]|uniref:Egf domain-specific o-linked n-acetylglucosamine transferase n=1 Tax=Phtheirospermum japonicum TaxID=374723 RepID=A0A830B593_9LAMI|nr:egf domain-specific o-linked n-acetylglucosamine transferase [Phtheirospermum japonicum]
MQHLSSSQVGQQKPFNSLLQRLVRGEDRRKLEATGFACDIAENSIVCISNLPVKIDTRGNVTVYYSSNTVQEETNVKPYALQKDTYLLQYITPVKILNTKVSNEQPVCQYHHTIPAVIFSSGISGNLFHEFNDIIIPLFITTKHLESRVLLILEDHSPSFKTKYIDIFSRLSSYEVMNPTSNASVHCFPGLILGLKYHNNLALNISDIPGGHSMGEFRMFLRETYHLKFTHVSQIRKPTLLLITRDKTRKFMNQDEMVTMMKDLGFRVIVAGTEEASNLKIFAGTVNSCGVLVGAHGAGLTNELFLPAGAVMVQVELLGQRWASDNYYGNPARAMELHYLRYKIDPEESSLVELYGRNHSVITNPESVYANGYRAGRAVYLDNQDVRIDIVKFRKIIVQALQLVKTRVLL